MSWQTFAIKVRERFLPLGLLCVIGPSFLVSIASFPSPSWVDFFRGLGVPLIVAGFLMKRKTPMTPAG